MHRQMTDRNLVNQIPEADHILQISLQESLTLAARLVSFTNCLHYSDAYDPKHLPTVQDRQVSLFFNDLIHFALHIRKIGEITGIKRNVEKLEIFATRNPRSMKTVGLDTVEERRFWILVDRIIHSQNIRLVMTEEAAEAAGFESLDCYADFRGRRFRECIVKSDREGDLRFSIEALVLTFIESIWPIIPVTTSDRGQS
jgi:hypothetical protein